MGNHSKNSINADKNIELILDYIKRSEYPIEKIYLFGSKAKKEDNEDSDYDLLFLIEDKISDEELKNIKIEIVLKIHRLIPGQAFDILVRKNSYFIEYKNEINTLYNEIFETGIIIYENRYSHQFSS